MSLDRILFLLFMTNPPRDWKNYDMNWDNPNALGYKYWYTLWLAVRERLSVLPTLNLTYSLINPPPYSVNMSRDWIYRFLKGIELLAHYYVDLDYCLDNPPNDLFDTSHAMGDTSSTNRIFPYVFNYNRLVTLYPSFEKYLLNYLNSSLHTDIHIWLLKELMLDIYSLLNKMVYTMGYLKNRPNVVYNSYLRLFVDGESFSDFVQSFMNDFAADNDTYMSYNKVSYNNIGYGDANDLRVSGGVTVGAVGRAIYKYSDGTIRYEYYARPYIVKNFAVQIPNDRLPNLLQLTYVPHLDFVLNNYLNLNTYGYALGLSIKDLGVYDGFRNVEIVSADKLKFPSPSELPSVEWDGYFPKLDKYLLNGCRMSVALLLDYRRSFLFSNHLFDDDVSNSDSE